MRDVAMTAYLVFAAFPAFAGDGGEGGFSLAAGLVKSLGSLAVVLGIIYLLTHLSRRWLKGGLVLKGRQSHIRVVETRHLGPKKTLLLVEVAGEYLLLGNGSEGGITLIKQIDMLEDIEVIEVLGQERPARGLFQEKLEGIMARARAPRLMALVPRSEG